MKNKLLTFCKGSIISALILSILAILTQPAFAAQLGGQAGSFLRVGLGAERLGMGDCGVALTGAGMNWYYNPAGIPAQHGKQAALGYRFMSLDRSMMYTGYSMPLQGNAGVGIGFMRAATTNIDARDSNGNRFDMLTDSDNLIHGSFALMPNRHIALGISLKWMIHALPNIIDGGKTLYTYGMGVDLGVRIVAMENLRFGLQWRDISAKYSWNTSDVWGDNNGTKDDEFPHLIRIGGAWDPRPDLTVASDLIVNPTEIGKSSDGISPHFGAEYRFYGMQSRIVSFRAGWNGDSPTFGLGITYKFKRVTIRMDYAYLFEKVAPNGSHVIGWVFEL
jgi:hypothetical protein